MKFGSYQPVVEQGTLQNVPLWRSRDINAYGGEGQGFAPLAKTVLEAWQKEREQQDAADVMAARNEIMTRLTGDIYGENGLYATGQGKNAAGLMNRVTQRIHDVTAEVGKQYNPRVRQTLLKNLRENVLNMQRNAGAREFQEFQRYKKDAFLGDIANNNQMAGMSYADRAMFDGYVKSNDTALAAYGNTMGWSGAELSAARSKYTGEAVQRGVAAALADGDDETALSLLEGYRNRLDPVEYQRLLTPIKRREEIKKDYADMDEIYRASGGDMARARALIMEKYGPTAKRPSDGMGGTITPYELPTQGADIDEQVKNLKEEFRGILPTIGGILQQLGVGDGAKISSGARSYEHQMEVNPDAPNSYHVSRDAVDIVLPDGISAEKAEEVKAFFENSGAFAEVLYHDAGSGYHLHLGGYQGGLSAGQKNAAAREVSAYDPEKMEKALKYVEGKIREEKHAERESRAAYLKEIDGTLAGMDWESGQRYLDEQNLTLSERNRFDSALATANGISRRAQSGKKGSSSGVTAKAAKAADQKIAAFGIDLSNGNWIRTNQFVAAREAGYTLEEAGLLSDDEIEELETFQNSPDDMHILTLSLEKAGNNIGTAYDDLVERGMDPKVAAIVISRIAPTYLSEHYQGGAPGAEYEDQEEEN